MGEKIVVNWAKRKVNPTKDVKIIELISAFHRSNLNFKGRFRQIKVDFLH
jgi:hypothetical protein